MEKQSQKLVSSVLYLTVAALVLCFPIFILSIFNFGLSSRWFNGGVSIVTTVYCMVFIGLRLRERMRSARSSGNPAAIAVTLPINQPESTPKSGTFRWESTEPIPISHCIFTICLQMVLALAHIIAFIIMVDITMKGGAKSTHPAERDPSVTYPWNMKVQIGQTACIGVEALVLASAFAVSYVGRTRLVAADEDLRSEIEWGVTEAPKSAPIQHYDNY
ncbi:hypothetical protein FA15DRAFT_688596 [Coprinopsis marcescibilis]|uniref:Uncharacterized protein n=1 Tax=Coprinopsis marcescibilis TaxID=230819 RepID=A0A5C3KP71_COPMA|nr:hypothetical protein FA15DRAFT_688596 [Coprinopsis marcescibilis]